MPRDRFANALRMSALFLAAALFWVVPCHAAPIVHLSRTAIDFGPTVYATTSSVQPVFVTNTGDAPLTITALTLGGPQAGDFAVTGTCGPPLTIAPGGQCRIDTTVTVQDSFVPQQRIGTLTLASNATLASATISLSVSLANFAMLPSPPWIDFGNQIIGTSTANRTVTLFNSSPIRAKINSDALIGGDAQDFTLTSDCIGKTVGAALTCTAMIGFTPSAAGPRSTEFNIDVTPSDSQSEHRQIFYSITGVGTSGGSPGTLNIDQQGLTGSWYQAATSGQGLEVEVFPDQVAPGTGSAFVSWFTYDTVAGGADHQRWYTLAGPVVSGQASAALTIYQNTGGNFNAPPVTNAQAVGTATLSFDTCSSGRLVYNFTDGTGRTGAIPLTRLTPNVTCSATSPPPTNADFAHSGNWFAPATSGQGFTIDFNPITGVFTAWYTYAPSGAAAGAAGQRWYTAQAGAFAPGTRSVAVQIYQTTGGVFDAPAAATTVQVGTGTLAFQSCTAATFSYNFSAGSSSGLSGTIALSRVGPVPAGCAQ